MRVRKLSSRRAATSGSLPGRTCWRLTISVTSLPKLLNMWTNSTPVTPEPTITRCCGTSGGGYAWRVVSTRRPSGVHHSGTRGRLPVDSTITSAVISRRPPAVSTTTSCGPASDPVPLTTSTP